MPVSLHDLEEWKDGPKKMVPSGECICAGCSKKLRKRKYSTTHFEHLADVEQPYKYCRECLSKGHDMVFPRSYAITMVNGKKRSGKRLPMTDEQRKEGQEIQRFMHGHISEKVIEHE